MPQGFDQLVSALQVRFDYQSSRIMVREALDRAGLKEQGDYSADQLQKFADGLNSVAKNLDRVWQKLGITPSGVTLPPPEPPKPAPKPPEPPKPEPVVEAAPPAPEPEPVVEAAPEPVVEAAPEPTPPAPEPEPAAEQVVEAAPEAPAAEETPSWLGGKKNKKNKNRGQVEAEAAPEGEAPSDNG